MQRDPAWYALRCGKVTASRVSDVLARTKSGWGASRANYAAELIAERLTGKPCESFTNAAMQWGIDQEGPGREAYCFYRDCDVTLVDFVHHPRIEMSGASPDGLIGPDGLVEIKCPNTAQHLETLLDGTIPEKYILQMQWQMACTERTWCDFCSFDPRLPERMRVFIKRIERDDKQIGILEKEVALFLKEIDTKLMTLRMQFGEAA